MSVIVMGMEMPMDCDSCCVPGNVCDLWIEQGVGNRHPDCPIRQLPEKHGRLIDADALIERMFDQLVAKTMMFGGQYVYTKEEINNAPTIVEAEGD